MDRVIDRMKSGQFMDFEVVSNRDTGAQTGYWTQTVNGWFEVYDGDRIMMNRTIESYFSGLSLKRQQTLLLHELAHIFHSAGVVEPDGDWAGPGDHPNNRLVEQNCGHITGYWHHGR